MRILLIAALAMFPHFASAAGDDDGGGNGGGDGSSNDNGKDGSASDSDSDNPPQATNTTLVCAEGEVWDKKSKACVVMESYLLNDDQRFGAVRELAYSDRPAEAMAVLETMSEGQTARVMTYRGFLLRKTGHIEAGIAAYEEAIRIDPANILARSYYGQLLVEMNEIQLAEAQLTAIRDLGGAGGWSERSLANAIATGVTYNF